MITCPRCGKQSPDGSSCCMHCGFPGDTPPSMTNFTSGYTSGYTASPMSPPMQPSMQMNTQSSMQMNAQPPIREQNGAASGGKFSRLVHSVVEEFRPNVWEIVAFLVAMCIPVLDIILWIKLGFGQDAPPLKKAFIRATLVLGVAAAALSILLTVITSCVVGASVARLFR